MNYINQHYTIKIFGFVPNSSFQKKTEPLKKTEPFCIFNNESFGLSYVPITETSQFLLKQEISS
ncbi:hypothetical protein RAMDARK_1502 [Rickettsia amblyommatis str. Darkwater]|nr:hypothetical protein RAMDARK_1502 [Rickettsia amblyommatis str. Darkwater]